MANQDYNISDGSDVNNEYKLYSCDYLFMILDVFIKLFMTPTHFWV